MGPKDRLRQKLLDQRQDIPAVEVTFKSHTIAEKLKAGVDWSSLKSVHVYKSVPAWHEVDTTELIAWIKHHWPQVDVLQPGLGKTIPLPTQEFDLIIVPVLGFDKAGHRLGLGGGWYDRFLATQPQALKIGLAWQTSFIESGIPAEPHDKPLDKVITDI